MKEGDWTRTLDDQPLHALSRYTAVTEGVIGKCQQDFRAGRDMGRSIPGLDATKATSIAVQSLAADALLYAPPEVILVQSFGSLDDWSLAVLAEILFAFGDQMRGKTGIPGVPRGKVLERAWAALEQALDSPTKSPMLWYEDMFFDVAQEYRLKGNRRAIELMKRALAHNLRHNKGSNADSLLPDLAETYLWLGELDQGLEILTALLRNDPPNIWTYNLAAITFDRFGLVDVGMEATRRGLDVLEATGDPEGLRDQLPRSVDDLRQSENRGREADVHPSVLANFRAALALDLGAGLHRPLIALCQELIPDLDQVPVKSPPQLPNRPSPTNQERRSGTGRKRSQSKARRRKGKKRR
jgi:tetratricopeptide (TPR) repeat protein